MLVTTISGGQNQIRLIVAETIIEKVYITNQGDKIKNWDGQNNIYKKGKMFMSRDIKEEIKMKMLLCYVFQHFSTEWNHGPSRIFI